jgi:Tol biopolymer transport system component
MKARNRIVAALAVSLALLVLLTAGPVAAKKPPKPPPGDEGVTNPALTYSVGTKVYVMSADGSQSSTIVGGGKDDRTEPTWLPDSRRVAFLLNYGLYTIKTDGTGLTYVRPLRFEFSFLTDRIILYSLWDAEVEIMDLVTGDTQNLGLAATLPSTQRVVTPSATPDLDPDTPGYQGWIAYSNNNRVDAPPGSVVNPDIHIVKLTGTTVGEGESGDFAIDESTITRLELDEPQQWPEWSADGGTIAYQHKAIGGWDGKKLAVVSVNLDQDDPGFGFGTPAVIYQTDASGTVFRRPAVSPDGRWIAFVHRFCGNLKPKLERIRFDGQGWKVLPAHIGHFASPHWNPVWTNDLD